MIILISVIAAIVVIWFLMLMPRIKHPENLSDYYTIKYAHRGLYDNIEVPENSLAAFRKAADNGYAVELDVHLTNDGQVVVFHDYSLMRMCGINRRIEELDYDEIRSFRLKDTKETIPTLQDVLNEIDGKATLLVEIKATYNNVKELCSMTDQVLSEYDGDYCVESFDPRVLFWYRINKPLIVRGQLSGYINKHGDFYKANGKRLNPFGDYFLRNLLVNCVGKPDFIAYREADRKNLSLRFCKAIFKIPIFYWTIKNDSYEKLGDKDTIIFEKR